MPLKKGCTKCCWCGYEVGSDNQDVRLLLHACTGEEKGAEPCPKKKECFEDLGYANDNLR